MSVQGLMEYYLVEEVQRKKGLPAVVNTGLFRGSPRRRPQEESTKKKQIIERQGGNQMPFHLSPTHSLYQAFPEPSLFLFFLLSSTFLVVVLLKNNITCLNAIPPLLSTPLGGAGWVFYFAFSWVQIILHHPLRMY